MPCDCICGAACICGSGPIGPPGVGANPVGVGLGLRFPCLPCAGGAGAGVGGGGDIRPSSPGNAGDGAVSVGLKNSMPLRGFMLITPFTASKVVSTPHC